MSSTMNGTSLTTNGVYVGEGGGNVSTNTAVGASALAANSTGGGITAIGATAGSANTADYLTAVGYHAAQLNTTGTANSAFGSDALQNNTTGAYNTAIGRLSLNSNTTASNNTAVGYQALYSQTAPGGGQGNLAIGYKAGYSAVGGYNCFVGTNAGVNSNSANGGNNFIGYSAGSAVTSGYSNTILGGYSGNQGGLDIRTASNWIVLSDGDGNPRGRFDNNGYFYCPGTYLLTTGSSANMFIATDGSYQRSTSALKYKQDIRDLEEIDISKFRPVRYKSKCETDDQTVDRFGVIADEVAEAGITELVSYGADGEVEGFQYERLTVVLLKSLQTIKAELDIAKAEIATLKGQ